MTTKHYFPATSTENVGISKHEDGNVLTFVFQDEVGGLEVRRDGHWIPVLPSHGTLVVNIGDVIQARLDFVSLMTLIMCTAFLVLVVSLKIYMQILDIGFLH